MAHSLINEAYAQIVASGQPQVKEGARRARCIAPPGRG